MPPLAVEDTLGGAPWVVVSFFCIVFHCGTRVVHLVLVQERKDAWRAVGGATASSWTEKNPTNTLI